MTSLDPRATPTPGLTLQAVLPLAISGGKESEDLIRAQTLLKSLGAAIEPSQKLVVNVVGRAGELDSIRAALEPLASSSLALKYHDEVELLPELAGSMISGWYKQQIIKLSPAEWLDADWWLILDADVVCVRRFAIEDLVPFGRPLARMIDAKGAPLIGAWQRSTAQVLGYERYDDTRTLDMTPAIFVRAIVQGLHREIERVAGTNWRQALLDSPVLHNRLGRDLAGWTELTLYQLFADRHGLWARHHTVNALMGDDRLRADGSVEGPDHAPKWTPVEGFSHRTPGYFIICGSHTGISARHVADAVAPHIERVRQQPRQPLPWSPSLRTPGEEPLQYMRKLSHDPPIYYSIPMASTPMGVAQLISPLLAEMPAFFLIGLWWTYDREYDCRALVDAYRLWQLSYPHHAAIVLCNTQEQADLLARAGVSAVLCHQNLSLDERIFRPDPEAKRRFDAVYNAGLAPFKRHLLACDIASLALIYGNWHVLPEKERDYVERVRAALPQGVFVNHLLGGGDYRMLGPQDCARWYNQARVGLCLSEAEGAMYSSMEYLMCGLPVVSTPSRGGRDYFFDAETALIVEPEPAAIAKGVRDMIDRRLEPEYVRRRTLEKVQAERRKLLDLLRLLFARAGRPFPGPQIWDSFFVSKMIEPVQTAELPYLVFHRRGN